MTCNDCYHNGIGCTFFEKEGVENLCKHFKDKSDIAPVVHGRWVAYDTCTHVNRRFKNPEKWSIYKCSVCGYSNGRRQSNYCPHCGAKMDLEVTNEN